MIKIFIQGLEDGLHDVRMTEPISEVPDMYEEYFGEIKIEGGLRKLGGRYNLTGEASCMASLTCDLTLEEFDERITVDLNLAFIEGDNFEDEDEEEKEYDERVIGAEDKFLDITNDIRELFAVSLPMKKVAPKHRGKDFSDIYPEYSADKDKKDEDEIDDRWAPLKNLKNN